jgi:hypothetical protein
VLALVVVPVKEVEEQHALGVVEAVRHVLAAAEAARGRWIFEEVTVEHTSRPQSSPLLPA